MNIRDPKTSTAVGVTAQYELRTSGVSFTMTHYEAHMNSNVYIVTHKISAPDTSSNSIMYMLNTNTDDNYKIVPSECIISADANAEWEVYTGTTRASGGGLLTPVNTNTLSSNTLLASVYGSNVGDFVSLTGAKKYFGRYTTATNIPFEMSWDDSLLVGYNSSFGISCKTTTSANIYINLVLVSHRIHT